MTTGARVCVVVGAGAQGRVTLETWRAARPDARFVFLDDDASLHGRDILGARVEGPVARAKDLGGEVLVALGNNRTRLSVAQKLEGLVRFGVAIHPSAIVSPSAKIGAGTVILPRAVVHTGANVGEHVVINTGVVVEHDAEIARGASLSPGTTSGGRIVVGEGAFVGTGVTLGPRVRVGSGSVVGAGSVVVRDIPDGVLAYGVPARAVRAIDESFDWRRLL